MKRTSKRILPADEMPEFKWLGIMIIPMLLGDTFFLWNSLSYSAGSDVGAIAMTVTLLAVILAVPSLMAWFLGAGLDHLKAGTGTVVALAGAGTLLAVVVAVLIGITSVRLSTADVTESASVVATNAASFGAQEQVDPTTESGEDDAAAFVMLMTFSLCGTTIFTFGYELVEHCMVLREKLVDTYRRRKASYVRIQIDAALAGIGEWSVQRQRETAERLREAEWDIATTEADQIIVEAEKDVALDAGDPAALPIAMTGTEKFEGTYAKPLLTSETASEAEDTRPGTASVVHDEPIQLDPMALEASDQRKAA